MSHSSYKATSTGELWLFVDEKKSILMEIFHSEVDAARCAMLLNDLIADSSAKSYDDGYDNGYTQGYRDGVDGTGGKV